MSTLYSHCVKVNSRWIRPWLREGTWNPVTCRNLAEITASVPLSKSHFSRQLLRTMYPLFSLVRDSNATPASRRFVNMDHDNRPSKWQPTFDFVEIPSEEKTNVFEPRIIKTAARAICGLPKVIVARKVDGVYRESPEHRTSVTPEMVASVSDCCGSGQEARASQGGRG